MCVLWNGNASVGEKKKTHHRSQVTLGTVENGIGWEALNGFCKCHLFLADLSLTVCAQITFELLRSSTNTEKGSAPSCLCLSVLDLGMCEIHPALFTGGDQLGSRSEFSKGSKDLDVDVSGKKLQWVLARELREKNEWRMKKEVKNALIRPLLTASTWTPSTHTLWLCKRLLSAVVALVCACCLGVDHMVYCRTPKGPYCLSFPSVWSCSMCVLQNMPPSAFCLIDGTNRQLETELALRVVCLGEGVSEQSTRSHHAVV